MWPIIVGMILYEMFKDDHSSSSGSNHTSSYNSGDEYDYGGWGTQDQGDRQDYSDYGDGDGDGGGY